MKPLLMFSVRDAKADAFMRPFFAQSEGIAVRGFTDEVNREGSELGKHPEDYALFKVGEFLEDEGMVTPLTQPVQMITAIRVVVRESIGSVSVKAVS